MAWRHLRSSKYSDTFLASSKLYPQALRIGTAIGILFHLEVETEMIRERTKEYSQEMEQEGITIEDILINKKNDFKNLANNCKMFYSNFSKMISNR
jgi:hypothetical protein